MTIATWGSFTFNVDMNKMLTFRDYTRKTSYKTEPKESGKNKPLTVDKGPELSAIDFKVQLVSSLGVDVDAETAKWHEACDAGKPYPLTIGGTKQGSYQWQLKSVNESAVGYDPQLKKVTALLQLGFVEYRGAGSAASTSTGSGNKKPASKPPKAPVTTVPNAVNNTPITQRPPSTGSQNMQRTGGSSGLLGS